MIGCVTVRDESNCCLVSLKDVNAAMMRLVFGVDLIRIVHPGMYVSHYSPSLRRPVIWSSTTQ